MKLTWYGQASFGITSDSGLVIVTDPYDPDKAAYKPFPTPADIVIKSSSNDDYHDNDHLVPKKDGATVIDALQVARGGGETESHGVTFRAVEAAEHEQHFKDNPDANAMYRFNVDGVEIAHMGDVGNPLSDTQTDFFRGVDVLLALTGGYPVIELDELKRLIDETKPKWVVPMHFQTLRLKPRGSLWLPSFLKYFSDEQVDFAYDDTAEITPDNLPIETRVLVIDYI